MRQLTKILGTAVFLVSSVTGARAAPQILGVVATAAPLTLQCAEGRCQVEVSTLCLQAKRQTPLHGHVYEPMDPSVFSVVARTGAGKTIDVPLPDAAFRVARGYTASRVAFATAGMRSRGLTPVALRVAAGTILIPAPVPGDTDPITRAEVRRATDKLWPRAEHVLDKHRQKREAIGMVNRLLNETPLAGRMTAAARKDLWRDTFGAPLSAAAGGGAGLAAGAFATCRRKMADGLTFTLRECLEERVDDLLTDINVAYWREAKHEGG